MHPVLQALEQRFTDMFAVLAAGDDLPPSARLRAEGIMEAVVIAGIADEARVIALMERCYAENVGRDLVTDFGVDWQAWFPFPQIPAMARRAPVYPSTPQ
ncbi:MAG: hypothetical protein R3E54_15905 [Halioglobus sp.]